MLSQQLCWSTRLWRHVWTTATPCLLGHPSPPQTSYSEYWMLLLALSATRRSTTVDSPISCMHDELHWLDVPQPMHVQAVCNGLLMSAAQSSTVHDRLLHPYVRHCSSPASAVRRLPSAVRTATAAFDVRSSCLFCSRPSGLELVTRLPASHSFDSFHWDVKTVLVLLAYTVH